MTKPSEVFLSELSRARSSPFCRASGRVVFAHRGVRATPWDKGNNEESISLALKFGIPMEIDVYCSERGELFISHGPLVELFAGIWAHRLDHMSSTVKLSQVMESAKDDTAILLDIKHFDRFSDDSRRRMAELIEKCAGAVFISSFSRSILELRKYGVRRPIGLLSYQSNFESSSPGTYDFYSVSRLLKLSAAGPKMLRWTFPSLTRGLDATQNSDAIPICDIVESELSDASH